MKGKRSRGCIPSVDLRLWCKCHTKDVRFEDVAGVTRELRNYRRFRDLISSWVQLEIDLAKLMRDECRSKIELISRVWEK